MVTSESKQWTRVRTLGRGASGAEVFLAADDASGELFAVKSASASGAAALRREQAIMSPLRSQRVVSCIGGHAGRHGSYQLFLEFAPGGSLADEVARCAGGSLDEATVRAYAADVARGLEYLHGVELVHGDVKPRNVVIGADGRAKLADFGCARSSTCGGKIIGGTPAFMAPEVARGEEQGTPADVWALGCTIVEMATGRAPWSCMDGDALATMHRIGYTDAVPEVPPWLSADAKDFLAKCLIRQPAERCTAAQLLEHPFLVGAGVNAKLEAVMNKWVSPKSTLDAALWESEPDTEDELSLSHSSAERIKALSCHASALPDWDSDEGWIDVLSAPAKASDAVPVPAEDTTDLDDAMTSEAEPIVLDITVKSSSDSIIVLNAGEAEADSIGQNRHRSWECLASHDKLLPCTLKFCNRIMNDIDFVLAQTNLCFALPSVFPLVLPLLHSSATRLISQFRQKKNKTWLQRTPGRSRSHDSENPGQLHTLRPHRSPKLPLRRGSSRRGKSCVTADVRRPASHAAARPRACKWTPSREPGRAPCRAHPVARRCRCQPERRCCAVCRFAPVRRRRCLALLPLCLLTL